MAVNKYNEEVTHIWAISINDTLHHFDGGKWAFATEDTCHAEFKRIIESHLMHDQSGTIKKLEFQFSKVVASVAIVVDKEQV